MIYNCTAWLFKSCSKQNSPQDEIELLRPSIENLNTHQSLSRVDIPCHCFAFQIIINVFFSLQLCSPSLRIFPLCESPLPQHANDGCSFFSNEEGCIESFENETKMGRKRTHAKNEERIIWKTGNVWLYLLLMTFITEK